MSTEANVSGEPPVLDPRRLKALAHPLRIELLERLLDHGPSTANALGRAIGQNSGTTSYHMRRLADVGMIKDATHVGTGRDRHWKATGGYQLSPQPPEGAANRAHVAFLSNELINRGARRANEWLARSEQRPQEWRDAVTMADVRMNLTASEMKDLGQQLLDVVVRYRDEHPPPSPGDAARLVAQIQVVPIDQQPTAD